jgi:serine/threonine protein kinase
LSKPAQNATAALRTRLLQANVSAALFGDPAAHVQLGRYRLVRFLGEGGMGSVFEAFEPESAERVALKVLHAHGGTGLQRLEREFQMLANLRHRNLVQYRELAVEEGADAFLVMELIDGHRFADYVRPHRTLDYERLRLALSQLVAAVSFLHEHEVLHRDLKISNLLVARDGRLVVLDFGVARYAGDLAGSGSGTRKYMAPERLRGEPASEASDWFSVGVILASMLGPETGDARRQEWVDLSRRLRGSDPAARPRGPELMRVLA